MYLLITILIILVGLLGYLLYINFRKAELAETYCETYVRFISILYFKFTETRDKMKSIDRIGAFQADDEVGAIFKELDTSIEELYEFITKYVNEQTKEAEETKN